MPWIFFCFVRLRFVAEISSSPAFLPVFLFPSRISVLILFFSFFFFFFFYCSSTTRLFLLRSLRRRQRHDFFVVATCQSKSESHVLPISRQLNLVHARTHRGCYTAAIRALCQGTPTERTPPIDEPSMNIAYTELIILPFFPFLF